jgi:hypothetical protein
MVYTRRYTLEFTVAEVFALWDALNENERCEPLCSAQAKVEKVYYQSMKDMTLEEALALAPPYGPEGLSYGERAAGLFAFAARMRSGRITEADADMLLRDGAIEKGADGGWYWIAQSDEEEDE